MAAVTPVASAQRSSISTALVTRSAGGCSAACTVVAPGSAHATTPGARNVNFSFLQPSMNPFVDNVTAAFTMNGTVTNTKATLDGSSIVQNNVAGNFSFKTTTALTVGTKHFAAGANLLSGTFTMATLSGARAGTSGGLIGSTPVSVITYTSDFLSFVGGSDYDMSFGLNSITTQLVSGARLNSWNTGGTPDSALRTFRGLVNGQFSSNPAPIASVPEPGSWAMMIAGMGMIGFARRRRRITVAA